METDRVNLIVLLLFLALAAAIPALIVARHFFGMDPVAFLSIDTGRTAAGILFLVLAVAVVSLNVALAWVFPWLYRREHGSTDGYHGSSGLPVISDVFVGVAAALLPSSAALGLLLMVLFVANPTGLAAFSLVLAREGRAGVT